MHVHDINIVLVGMGFGFWALAYFARKIIIRVFFRKKMTFQKCCNPGLASLGDPWRAIEHQAVAA